MRFAIGKQILDAAGDDNVSPVRAGAGADVDQVIAVADAVLIVLDHDHAVADVAQAVKRADEPRVVALVQADRRLIEHVADADEF